MASEEAIRKAREIRERERQERLQRNIRLPVTSMQLDALKRLAENDVISTEYDKGRRKYLWSNGQEVPRLCVRGLIERDLIDSDEESTDRSGMTRWVFRLTDLGRLVLEYRETRANVAQARRDRQVSVLARENDQLKDQVRRLSDVVEENIGLRARLLNFESIARSIVDGQLTENEADRGRYRRALRALLDEVAK